MFPQHAYITSNEWRTIVETYDHEFIIVLLPLRIFVADTSDHSRIVWLKLDQDDNHDLTDTKAIVVRDYYQIIRKLIRRLCANDQA